MNIKLPNEITAEEAKGKTVELFLTCFIHPILLIKFTDGTFTCFRATHGYEDDIDIEEGGFELFSFSKEELAEAGILTIEEYERYAERREQWYKDRQASIEKAQYERLKAKFDSNE